ncbi:MAG TPA: hypothetical protein VGN17_31255 [Bryobacteraceae bacterium]
MAYQRQGTLPYGATIEYQYASIGNSAGVNETPVTQRKVTHSDPNGTMVDTWSYTIPISGANGTSSILNPDGGTVKHYFYARYGGNGQFHGQTYKIVQPDGSEVDQIWGSQTAPAHPANLSIANPFVQTEIRSVASSGSPQKSAVKQFSYDLNGNLLQTQDYDWINFSQVVFGRHTNSIPARRFW